MLKSTGSNTMNYDILVSKGIGYATAAILNWDARRSRITRHYITGKVYGESSLYHRDVIRLISRLEERVSETMYALRQYHEQQARLNKILKDCNIAFQSLPS